MPDFIAHSLIFFSAQHPIRAIIAGMIIIWIGMAVFYLATRRRAAGTALKVLGLAIAAYGGGHASAGLMVLSGSWTA